MPVPRTGEGRDRLPEQRKTQEAQSRPGNRVFCSWPGDTSSVLFHERSLWEGPPVKQAKRGECDVNTQTPAPAPGSERPGCPGSYNQPFPSQRCTSASGGAHGTGAECSPCNSSRCLLSSYYVPGVAQILAHWICTATRQIRACRSLLYTLQGIPKTLEIIPQVLSVHTAPHNLHTDSAHLPSLGCRALLVKMCAQRPNPRASAWPTFAQAPADSLSHPFREAIPDCIQTSKPLPPVITLYDTPPPTTFRPLWATICVFTCFSLWNRLL